MRSRGSQFDVAHTLTAYFSLGHFNAALLTDDATVFQALVLTAQALVIFYRPKDTGAEKAVTFWFERTVVDGFRLLTSPKTMNGSCLAKPEQFDRIKLFGFSLRFQKL